ncbi:hypothetical protein DPMN_050355 [Dreissena polymorpha]|uniref:Uncharacterized protein n=1 Tax=Dreissena polymorpha TaxID=45954 RepID=A0A9D4CHP4_DREPO|nr:hypothetical protein DPMN_050355 [Dreissena polymorpha]
MIKFIIFRIACPALITEHTNTSHWHLDGAELHNDTLMNYDANVPLRCDSWILVAPLVDFGQPKYNSDTEVRNKWDLDTCCRLLIDKYAILRELFDVVSCD